MSTGSESITVRRLPDGAPCAAHLEPHGPEELLVSTPAGGSPPPLTPGAMVEIQSPSTIYLGQVLSQREDAWVIRVEHHLSRATLSELTQAWNGFSG